jgi:hypothetical protein
LVTIYDALDEAIKIVRKSDGRSDAAEKLRARFKLTEIQSFAVVDMRIYQLSRTNIDEIKKELAEKARALEAVREEAKKSSPWIGYASTAYQLAIVVLSASILAVSMGMFWGSFLVAGVGIALSLNGLFLWF